MLRQWLSAFTQRPRIAQFIRVTEVLFVDAAIAIVNMVLIAAVGWVAHALHLDTHALYMGITVADLFRVAHVLNLFITLGFGLYHLARELRSHP
jgi:hypothetical protein